MSKKFEPGYTLSEPPVIIIGGVDTPPTRPSKEKPSDLFNMDRLDEYLRDSESPIPCDIEIPEDAKLVPLEACTIRSIPRERKESDKKIKKERKKDRIRREKEEIIAGLRNKHPEPDDSSLHPIAELPAEVPEHKTRLSEHQLYRILTSEYIFGCYGSSLYVRNSDGVYSEVTTSSIERLLMTTLTEEQKERFSIRKASAVRSRLLASSEVRNNQLYFPVDKVLFSNGCFDIINETPAIMKRHDFFITRINARYVPGKELDSPYFDAYLQSCSGGDISIQRRICAMLGYLMLSGYPGKKIIVLGTARNSGKSMISRFYQRLVGPELVSGQTPFEMSESHASSEFSGKIANMAMDIPATTIKPAAVSVLKAISGSDVISTNPKGRDRRSMICFAKQVLGTNAGLKLQQFDEAFWERVEVIPYIFSIDPEDRIYDLEDRLMGEKDAIVTRCIQEARLLIMSNYRFPECDAADLMKDAWMGWFSFAKDFLLTNCVAEEGAYTPSTPLYDKYVQHCQEHMLPYGSKKGFIGYAKKLFPSDGNPHRMINGVQLRGLPDVRFLGKFD